MQTDDDPTHDATTWTRWLSIVLVAGALLGGAVWACGTAANILLPPEREEQLGDEVEAEFLDTDVELYDGSMAREYIKQMGDEAVAAAGEESPEPIEYEFRLIDDDETVNAFAMPGGQIYFYTGLLRLAETKAEVMSVMAHEVAHVTQRHIAKRLAAQYGLEALVQAALGENPGLVAELGTLLVTQGALLQHSRDHERESDTVGMEYMIEAGYDPQGFVDFFQKLEEQSGGSVPTILSSHPSPGDRVESAREQIGDRSFDNATVGRRAHQQILDALGQPDDPDSDAGGDVM